jgi:hypothetical protein
VGDRVGNYLGEFFCANEVASDALDLRVVE